jgi:hypothetical protein
MTMNKYALLPLFLLGLTSAHAGGEEFSTVQAKGKFGEIANDAPKSIVGELTLPLFRKPMSLSINSFKCIEHPAIKDQACAAGGIGSSDHADLALNDGSQVGFKRDSLLRFQFQGIKAN